MFTEKRDASLSSRFALLINDYMSAHSKEQRILIAEIYEMRSWMRKYIILYTTFVRFTKHATLSSTTDTLSISLFSLWILIPQAVIEMEGIGGLIPIDDMLPLIIDAKDNKHDINMFAWVANMNFVQRKLKQ